MSVESKDVNLMGNTYVKRDNFFLKILQYKKKNPLAFYFMATYLGGVFAYIVIFHVWFADFSKPMPLNEVGDFLAGVFSPIAFLYLYLGYVQQGEELKLQAEELSNLVKEQRKQNEIYENELAIKRIESKPKIVCKNAGYTYRIYEEPNGDFEGTTFYFSIVNLGSIAKDILITGKGIQKTIHKLETDKDISISFSYSYEMGLNKFQGKPFFIEMDMTYCDNSGYQYQNKIKLDTDNFIDSAIDIDFDMNIEIFP